MARVTIALNGRTYRLSCGEGEEARLNQLADVVRVRLDQLVSEYGQAGEERLLLMSALLIADELLDTKARLAETTANLNASLTAGPARVDVRPVEARPDPAPEPSSPPLQPAAPPPVPTTSPIPPVPAAHSDSYRIRIEKSRAARLQQQGPE